MPQFVIMLLVGLMGPIGTVAALDRDASVAARIRRDAWYIVVVWTIALTLLYWIMALEQGGDANLAHNPLEVISLSAWLSLIAVMGCVMALVRVWRSGRNVSDTFRDWKNVVREWGK